MINWLTKIGEWKEKDFNAAEHVRKSFESTFPSIDPNQIEMQNPPPDTIFLDSRPAAKHTYVYWGASIYDAKRNQKYQVQSLALFANNRYYKVEINNGPIHEDDMDRPTNVPKRDDARLWVTAHGFRGSVTRIYDDVYGTEGQRNFPEIIAKDPLDFVNQVAEYIRSDKRRDDNEEPEPEPIQPDPTPIQQNSPVLVSK